MKKLKRDPVKYIRDKAKSKYEKGTECYICGADTELDFHHFYTLSPLLSTWFRRNKNRPALCRRIFYLFRDEFIEEA
jgi:hypothetical protein